MSTNLALSQAFEGFVNFKIASGKAPSSIASYRNSFKKLKAFLKTDPRLAAVTKAHLIDFFAWLQESHVTEPGGVATRGALRLSPKSILNVHTDLSAFWAWALHEGYVAENLVRCIDPPPVSPPVIEPLTKDEMIVLVKACSTTSCWKTRPSTSNHRPTSDRDRAIVMVLVDTGIRASELCDIRFRDINFPTRSIRIRGKGPGRGPKERMVYMGARTAQAVLRVLTPQLGTMAEDDHVFVVGLAAHPRPMGRNVLGRLLRRLGDRAGIRGVHPDRLRHTFAITYLRNQGDVFTLQDLLGHSDLAMSRRYARIAQVDCAQAHQRASPVDNWRL